MGLGLLFVPLVGGYLFLTRCHWTRFSVRRQSGYRLLFGSAAAGLILVSVARLLAVLADERWQSRALVGEYWPRVAPFPFIGTIALAFILGPMAAFLINRFYTESKGAMRAVHRARNSMELLFVESMSSDSLVEVTLVSGKVYVGWILNASVAEPERKFVEILPMASGFRTKDTHELRFTTNYAPVLILPREDTEPATDQDFRVVVSASEVRSARPFDFAIFFEFQELGTVD